VVESLAFFTTLGDAGVQPGPVRPDDDKLLVEPTAGRRVDSGALGGTTRLRGNDVIYRRQVSW